MKTNKWYLLFVVLLTFCYLSENIYSEEIINKMEKYYRELILRTLQSIFSEDQVRDVDFTIKLKNNNLGSVEDEFIIDCIIVNVNIDGIYKFKYDEKQRYIISPNGSRERVYIPISTYDLKATQRLIQDAIGYNSVRGDIVSVSNIPFDRTLQFIAEDASYFRQQKIKIILLLSVCLLIICFSFWLIFKIKYKKKC
jgi:flagellar biosynthesis/type III secretory pathway M-ring protein FliF/YscJ